MDVPRLLRAQVDLAKVFARHLVPVQERAWAATPKGFAELEEDLGGELDLSCQVPYLLPLASVVMGDAIRGARLVAIEAFPARYKVVLAVDRLLCDAIHLDDESLTTLLQKALFGAPLRVIGPCTSADIVAMVSDPSEQVVLGMDIGVYLHASMRGWVRLISGPSLRVVAPPQVEPLQETVLKAQLRRLAGISIPMTLVAGFGYLQGKDVLGLAEADVVVLEHFGPRPVTGGPIKVQLGRGSFAAHLDGDGVTILRPYAMDLESMADTSQEESSPKTPIEESEKEARHRALLLSEMRIPVQCEIGRVVLSGKEIAELRPGAVIPVGRPLSGPVDLTCSGRLLARGELVDIEGEIGVRITEIWDDAAAL